MTIALKLLAVDEKSIVDKFNRAYTSLVHDICDVVIYKTFHAEVKTVKVYEKLHVLKTLYPEIFKKLPYAHLLENAEITPPLDVSYVSVNNYVLWRIETWKSTESFDNFDSEEHKIIKAYSKLKQAAFAIPNSKFEDP
jgi:hypothetical protein